LPPAVGRSGGRTKPEPVEDDEHRARNRRRPCTRSRGTHVKRAAESAIAILAADGVERIELEQPRGALHGAGATTELLSIHDGTIRARQQDLDEAATFQVEKLVSDASVNDYDAPLLPGGTVNPDQLRSNRDPVQFVEAFVESGKPIAAICHGPWTLVEADVVRGRRMTSWPSIRTDLRNAGAEVVDEEVVIDGQLTTSRSPADLPAFCLAIVGQFSRAGEHAHV
jgi:protease I